MKNLFAALLVSFLLMIAPASLAQQQHKKNTAHQRDSYQEAIVDAMVAEESEICSTLIAIRPDNKYLSWSNGYVLVCTWTGYPASFHPGDTLTLSWGDTWVTAVPELKDWQKQHRRENQDPVLRTKQLLGLPVNANKTTFVEMWVKPADLFRPAYDNEIDDRTCGLSFPANATQEYIDWFDNNIISSYYPPRSTVTFPWTRLGYTYDWGNPRSEIGLSEFVIKKSSRVIVKSVTPNEVYLK